MHEHPPRALPIPDRLGRALTADSLAIAFQPIVDLADGSVRAVEALCRPTDESGYSTPIELFDEASEHACSWDIERAIRSRIVALTRNGWPSHLDLFINCSPAIIADDRFAETIEHELEGLAFPREQIVLEITEQAGASECLRANVDALRHRGVRIAVDDLGAGANGMNRVLMLRPDWLKLDREMVRGVEHDPVRQNTIRFFMHFASMNGGQVIAEGIETSDELRTLAELGVRYVQGFYIARPASIEHATSNDGSSSIRDRVLPVTAEAPAGGSSTSLRSLAESCCIAQGQTTVARAYADLLRAPMSIGVTVLEGRRLIGWCDRAALERALSADADRTLASVMQPAICLLPGVSSVREGLDLMCARDDEHLLQPLLISTGDDQISAVPVRRLLQALASESLARQLASGVAGLPTRSMADHHLASTLNEPHAERDGAVIDLRRFTEYNAAFGHELGERVVSDLALLLGSHITTGASDYLAHLGGDRFLITAPAGTLRARLDRIASEVDGGALVPTLPEPGQGEQRVPLVPISLRICFIPQLSVIAEHPRDVYRLEQQLRQKGRAGQDVPGQTQLIVDERRGLGAVRLSA